MHLPNSGKLSLQGFELINFPNTLNGAAKSASLVLSFGWCLLSGLALLVPKPQDLGVDSFGKVAA